MARRRTLHEVWCDEGINVTDHKVIFKDGALWVSRSHYIADWCYERITNKTSDKFDWAIPDVDELAENYYEAFEHEKKTIETLFTK